ncbi:PREDICTED: protein O-linked-mannose beta-1,2-N-acetylglucosaminyltransferase 1-like [Branchiostoma belcheri]|uniref:Protein O-linked-mannose beta-1,2-N-acetylglucosaminyltransferase 1-like n=1 Tax=Branchiostoma belcheri TaxID=7741 RepID=A0A6P4ZJV5_BRABE|nr:PREDICTED: protein O-linked-mannose beta-1,2-N-acetylglucosaminyltransferase 1-like [Branchiostoma belcheri]
MWGRRRSGIVRAILLLLVVAVVVYHGAKFYMDSLDKATQHEVKNMEQEETEEGPQPVIVDVEEKKEQVKPQVDIPPDPPPCGIQPPCSKDQFAFVIRSGQAQRVGPRICFDGKDIMSDDTHNAGRGMNIVVIDGQSKEVYQVDTFDLYDHDDAELIKFLQNRKDGQLVLVASYDDAAYKLTDESRDLLSALGSQHIKTLKFRDSWVFLGYKGSHGPPPKEEVQHHVDKQDEWPQQAEIQGCAPLPTAVQEQQPKGAGAAVQEQQSGGAGENSCAMYSTHCDAGSPVYVFAGDKTKNHWPEICVNGQYVIRGGMIGWRGLNVVVVDSRTFQVTQSKNIDTYEKGSSELEDLVWKLDETSLVMIATYDEASRKLSSYARSLLTDMGSSKVKDLGYRDSWVFIGQKGIVGVSPYEKHEKGGAGNFGGAVEIKACLTQKLIGEKQDDTNHPTNSKRKAFCDTYGQGGDYGDFCAEENQKESLSPAPLGDQQDLKENAVFSTPIVVIARTALNLVQQTLESLRLQPGINPRMVQVMSDGSFDEPQKLTDLYSFQWQSLQPTTKYVYQMHHAMTRVFQTFKDSKYAIFMDEGFRARPGFLRYFAQTLSLLDQDDSIFSVSAWNHNGFEGLSQDASLLYRTEDFPATGWVVRRSVWESEVRGKEGACCMVFPWHGWFGGDLKGKEVVVPDVSRVEYIVKEGLFEDDKFRQKYFPGRRSNSEPQQDVSDVQKMNKDAYEEEVKHLISSSTPVQSSQFSTCLIQQEHFSGPSEKGKVFTVYFKQENPTDRRVLQKLCSCFGLFRMDDDLRGLHKNMLRFTYDGNQYLLVGSESPYNVLKPNDLTAVMTDTGATA